MSLQKILPGSLVIYKNHPGRVRQVGEKLEIELQGESPIRVRLKDVRLLHPGPLASLAELGAQSGDVTTAWEILKDSPGQVCTLAELAELIYGRYTPPTAWAAWWWVSDGLYFRGEPQEIRVCSPQEVVQETERRQARAAEAQAALAFLGRLREGQLLESDRHRLRDVEELARGRRSDSRVLRDLGRSERPETAHALLLELGLWDETVNPYPQRLGVSLDIPGIVLGEISPAPRRDLTHLTAYAVDDPGNQEPDDALSWEDGRLWVHVADVAGLVTPDSPADLDARARGATLYLPEGAVPMLPPEVIRRLGLGFSDVSPALSFGIDLDALGEVAQVEIVLSQVRVERLSYEQAQERLEEAPFSALHTLAAGNLQRRLAAGAMQIDLPEVKLRIDQGQIEIYPILRLGSRTMVREAMLLAGEAAAQYALQHDLPIPFAIQDAPLEKPGPSASPGMAEQYALRRVQQRSAVAGLPGLHAGLGLSAYTRATSPLRRYLDLVVHQQIRAFLLGSVLLDEQQILERVGASEAIVPVINRAEILSVRHWTLVYLQRHPDWCGKAVLVDRRGRSSRFILPELAFETQLHLRKDLPMNSELTFALKGIDLAEQEAHFAVI